MSCFLVIVSPDTRSGSVIIDCSPCCCEITRSMNFNDGTPAAIAIPTRHAHITATR